MVKRSYTKWTKRTGFLPGHAHGAVGGADRAAAFPTGAAHTPLLLSRHLNASIRGNAHTASVAFRGLHSRSATAAKRGQTVWARSDASTLSPHISPSPPSTYCWQSVSLMFRHGSSAQRQCIMMRAHKRACCQNNEYHHNDAVRMMNVIMMHAAFNCTIHC